MSRAHSLTPLRLRIAEKRLAAFTLIELLVVLAVMGMLAAITLPALKNMRRTNVMVSAGRQLVDDFALARIRAISERTTVHVVFVPPDIMDPAKWPAAAGAGQAITRDQNLQKRLKSAQYTTYALFAERTVGDQPGRSQPRYLTSWRSLPDGIFIATNKFIYNSGALSIPDDYSRPFEYTDKDLPAPTIYGMARSLPHIAFDPHGRLVDKNNRVRFQNEVLWLGRGSFLYSRAPNGDIDDFDLRESPPGNSTDSTNYHRVVVDGLTGRARVETPRIQ
jgi:prepilin-type N-terminal cleavage/methylation domain-containing protein